jgi:7-carboxy-7-deazaguanine synthase
MSSRPVDAPVTTLEVSEIFHSIQGEGIRAGEPSSFVRLARCNLSCDWCDAAYTWKGAISFDSLGIDEVVARMRHESVIVTGGEPTIAVGFAELIGRLRADGRRVTVETNGTTWPASVIEDVTLWSVSPKIGSSGQVKALRREVLAQFAQLGDSGRMQFKFVIDDEQDFEDVAALLGELDVPNATPVFLQPNGLCRMDEYLLRVRWLYELVLANDGMMPGAVRVVPQLHKLAWGNRRGF